MIKPQWKPPLRAYLMLGCSLKGMLSLVLLQETGY